MTTRAIASSRSLTISRRTYDSQRKVDSRVAVGAV
jgi:hypothetical protein